MKKRFTYKIQEILPPKKAHVFDAGYDLFLPSDIEVRPFETKSIDLQVGINLSQQECAIVCMRSSYAVKGLIAQNSPIDYGYSGNIHLIITNCSSTTFRAYSGERICQVVIFKIPLEEDEEFVAKVERK